jgi:uncharacterized protein
LDALRGMALFGVLSVNLVTEFRVSLFEQFLPQSAVASPVNRVVADIIRFGLESKSFILFSLLFGVGLEVQRQRCLARGVPFARYAARRLGFLLAVGLVHLFLIWNGDILTLYALTGLVAAPLLALPVRALLPLALGLFVIDVLLWPYFSPFPDFAALASHVRAARDVYAHGSFGQVFVFRIQEVRPISALLLGSAPRTLALFLLGACAFRQGLASPARGRGLLALLAACGLLAGAVVPLSARWELHGFRDVHRNVPRDDSFSRLNQTSICFWQRLARGLRLRFTAKRTSDPLQGGLRPFRICAECGDNCIVIADALGD